MSFAEEPVAWLEREGQEYETLLDRLRLNRANAELDSVISRLMVSGPSNKNQQSTRAKEISNPTRAIQNPNNFEKQNP